MITRSFLRSGRPWSWPRVVILLALAALGSWPLCLAQSIDQSKEPALDRAEARRIWAPSSEVDLNEINLPPQAERKRQRILREELATETAAQPLLRIKALEGFLDYDEEDQIVYGPGRTRVRYGQFFLEADRVILDARLREAQAEGNVILQTETDTVYADSVRYNFDQGEGVAFNVSGSHQPVYFRATPDHDPAKPQFQKVSRKETIFTDTEVTGCDFKVPHYYVKGREVILFDQDRIFFRGATLYVWGTPVFYLPFYSRSLVESSPWFLHLGYGSETGGRIRLGYAYKHITQEPSYEDDDTYVTRARGNARLYFDYLSKLGPGTGFDYEYNFEYGKHRGQLELYGLNDSDRQVVGPTAPAAGSDPDLFDESGRWRVGWKHRTAITPDLTALVNVDEFSDPDIFYDVLDLFEDTLPERNRQIERRSRAALTWVREEYVVRLMADMRDRIGRNRVSDFSDPADDNRDFDLDPYNRLKDDDTDGISNSRWGNVSAKLPQLDIATRWLPVLGSRTPLFYRSEIHLYNNLDKGLNIVSDDDDTFVQGVEFYQALMHQWKLSQRYILLSKLGFGVGGADRDEDLGIDLSGLTFPTTVDGLVFTNDDDTFLIGTRERNYDQINNAYIWADASERLNARFSDALTGYVQWRYRYTTSDYIGDFLASLGDMTFRQDLYDYKIREHWIETGLAYRLIQPLLTLSTDAGYNLTGGGDLYSKEPIGYVKGSARWSNQRQTLVTQASAGWRRRQTYDPSDPAEYAEDKLFGDVGVYYTPRHQRWYTSLVASYENSLNGRAERTSDNKLTYFTDEDVETDIKWIYGRELGPKWDTKLAVHWDKEVGGLREVAWVLQRDLHDALAILKVRVEQDEEDADSRNDNSQRKMDVSLGLKLKLPMKTAGLGANNTSTLQSRSHEPLLAD